MPTYVNYLLHAISKDICDPIIVMEGSIQINTKERIAICFYYMHDNEVEKESSI